MTPPLMAESEEELKSRLMKVKVESENWLKAQHSENEDHGIRLYVRVDQRTIAIRSQINYEIITLTIEC